MKICDRCRNPAFHVVKLDKTTVDLCDDCYEDVYRAVSDTVGMTPAQIARARYERELSDDAKARIQNVLNALNVDGAWRPMSLEDLMSTLNDDVPADEAYTEEDLEQALSILIEEGYVAKRADGTYAGATFL